MKLLLPAFVALVSLLAAPAAAQTIGPVELPITIRLAPGYAVDCTQTTEVLTSDNQTQRTGLKFTQRTELTKGQIATILESKFPQVHTKGGHAAGPFEFALEIRLNEFGGFEGVEILEFQIGGMSEIEIRSERAGLEKELNKFARQFVGGRFSHLGKPLRSGDTLGSNAGFKSLIETLFDTKTSGLQYELRMLGESTAPSGEAILVFEQNGKGHILQNGNWVFFKFNGNYSAFQRSGLVFQQNGKFDVSNSSNRSAKVSQTTNCRQVSAPSKTPKILSHGEPTSNSDLTSRLEAVKRLLDQNLITETEAAKKRREILEGL